MKSRRARTPLIAPEVPNGPLAPGDIEIEDGASAATSRIDVEPTAGTPAEPPSVSKRASRPASIPPPPAEPPLHAVPFTFAARLAEEAAAAPPDRQAQAEIVRLPPEDGSAVVDTSVSGDLPAPPRLPAPPVPPVDEVPFHFAARMAEDPSAFAAVPVIRVTEDEDDIVARLFPKDVVGRPAGHVPATPTVGLRPEEPADAVLGEIGAAIDTGNLQESAYSEAELLPAASEDAGPSAVRPAQGGRRSVLNALLVIGHLLLLNVLKIPVAAYVMHRFSDLHYGYYFAAEQLVALTGLMSTLGLRPLFVRAVAQQPELAEEDLAHQLGLRGLLTLAACSLSFVVAWVLHLITPAEYTQVVLLCVCVAVGTMVLNVIGQTFADLLQGLHRMKTYSAINFASGVVQMVAMLYVAYADPQPVALSFAFMSGPIVGLLLFWIASRRNMRIRVKFDFGKYRELLRESRTIGVYQISVVLRDRLERVLLPGLTGMQSFGFYGKGIMPADRLFVVPEGFVTAFFPAISRSHHEDQSTGRRTASHHVLHLMVTSLVACLPIAILVTYFADPISRILMPSAPEICRDVIRITIWSVPLKALQLPMGCALQASGHHATAAKTGTAATFFSLAVTIGLILTMGIQGACWSWVGRAAISALFLVPAFMRVYPDVFSKVPVFRIATGLLLMGGLLWGSMQANIHAAQWVIYLSAGSAAIMVYFVAMVLLRVIEVSDLKSLARRRAS